MRILIIEDNVKTAEYLSKGLKENFFLPEIALDGEEGLFLASQHPYDLIILDVMLPKIDGWTLLALLRQERKMTTPILFLTAKDEVDDRIKGLQLGADDYLIKPFAFSELLARIQVILRRQQPLQEDIIQIDDLEIDTLKHKVSRAGKLIHLSPKEFMLLSFMAKQQGCVLSRTYLAEKVWDIHFDSDTNVIDVAIKRLRNKIDEGHSVKILHTVRGVGYVLEKR